MRQLSFFLLPDTLMDIFRIPFQRWPLKYHVILAVLLVTVCTLLCFAVLRHSQRQIDNQTIELNRLLSEIGSRRPGIAAVLPKFTDSLPLLSRSDDVVLDMSKHGQALNVQISSLVLTVSEPSAVDLRKVQFTLTAVAEYRQLKNWLSELLGRYPTLGVQTLSMRALPNDPSRQESQMSLVLFVR